MAVYADTLTGEGLAVLNDKAIERVNIIHKHLEYLETACDSNHAAETRCVFENTIKSCYPPISEHSAGNNDIWRGRQGQRAPNMGKSIIAFHAYKRSHQAVAEPSQEELNAVVDEHEGPGSWPKNPSGE